MNGKLISADRLIQFVENWGKHHGREEAADSFLYAIHNAPAVDAVEVVRCRDCKYWGDEEGIAEGRDFLYARCNVHNHFRYGEHFGWCPKEDDFCSCGERREENEVD